MAEPEIRYTTTADGVSIAYYTMGEGHPLVMTSRVLWSHLQREFVREYYRSGKGLGRGLQVVRYDARGTGLSDRHSLDFSMDARLLDLEAVVERLKLTRFAIAGGAHGAAAAITYAAANPERLSHVILSNAYARGRDLVEASRRFQSMRDTADEDWEHYTLTLASSNLGFSDSEAARELASLYRESMTPESVRVFFAAHEAIDVTALLPRIAVPTLVMYHPSPGAWIRLEWAREVASKIPNARFVTVTPQNGQLWTDEQTRIVEEFLGVNREASDVPTPDAAPPRGRAASAFRVILFTDIVGHTEMMQRLGDAKGREVLRDHERITREALQQHGGDEVKTDGDSFMATFISPSAAVACAIGLQRAFAQHGEAGGEPIVVRMGLNVGEPIEEEGDFFGSAVILASRIRDLAGGGEILVPEAVRHMLSGKTFVFADRGEFAMKGFEDAVRLYEVRWQERA
jgi:class 3 adenylate cyclase/alpha-beta hydrolase superfamily lysophospholipase